MDIRSDEITSIIKKELEKYTTNVQKESIGRVTQVGDEIVRIYGLDDVMMGELVDCGGGVQGMVLNLEEDSVGAVVFGVDNPDKTIKEGDIVKRTGKIVQVPVGEAVVGRVIDALGTPIDGKGMINAKKFRPLEAKSPGVVARQPVNKPLETGIKAIDAMIPIGRGQRELVIGDRQTGKTAIAIDTIINQKNKGVYCIYVAIGQKISSVVAVAETLEKYGAMKYTTIVSATASSSASMQYLAPYAGCAIGEEFMYTGKDALIIYDDLSKHAQSYRQLSLLLRRPPGREAYPGDIFYIHSRLLERASRMRDDKGGGSLTAIPIIEAQAGDITSYIPTNVISITDGQIYLETDLFYAGVRPAVNVGLSVSRVGGKAQEKAMRQVAAQLRLDLAQYRELVTFTQVGSELDKAAQDQLTRGEKMTEILKQDQFDPMSLSKQVMIIFAGTKGHLDDVPTKALNEFCKEFYIFMSSKYPSIEQEIDTKKVMSDECMQSLAKAVTEFKARFTSTLKN